MPWRRGLIIAILISSMPIAAQEKKSDTKETNVKKDEKKADAKTEKKTAPATTKYYVLNRVTGRLTNSDTQEMLVELELRVPSGRYGRNEKVTFKIANEAKFRCLKLPEKLDDKGKSVPYSAQEKSKLKGDNSKLPGYASEMSALKVGQIVEVELSTTKPPNPTGKKNLDDDEKPIVTMVVINEEAPQKIEKKKK